MKSIFFVVGLIGVVAVARVASAHQWDTQVPYLEARTQLVKTGSCSACELPSADLSYKTLANANLSGANLTEVNLMRADLKNADLSYTELAGATFTWADLKGVDFTGANLKGAVLAGSRNIGNALFCDTVMPDGCVNNANCVAD